MKVFLIPFHITSWVCNVTKEIPSFVKKTKDGKSGRRSIFSGR